jgi:1-acyl-sn-glycerol-3-phosphate acyltransferase
LDNFLRILARTKRVRLTVHFLKPLIGDALTNRKTIAATAREELLIALSR